MRTTGSPAAPALFLAAVAGDRDHLRRGLADADAGLRATALTALLRRDAVPDLGPLLRDLPAVTRDTAYRALRRTGQGADDLVDEVRATFGDREAVCTTRPTCPGTGPSRR